MQHSSKISEFWGKFTIYFLKNCIRNVFDTFFPQMLTKIKLDFPGISSRSYHNRKFSSKISTFFWNYDTCFFKLYYLQIFRNSSQIPKRNSIKLSRRVLLRIFTVILKTFLLHFFQFFSKIYFEYLNIFLKCYKIFTKFSNVFIIFKIFLLRF